MPEIITPTPALYWLELIEAIEEGSQKWFPVANSQVIRTTISCRIKKKHKTRKYKTRTYGEAIIVDRLNDTVNGN